MVILSMDAYPPCHLQLSPSPCRSNAVFCCIGDGPKIKQATVASSGVLNVASMHREIGERRQAFSTIFTPYHAASNESEVKTVSGLNADNQSKPSQHSSMELPYGEPIIHQSLQLSFSELELITNSFKTPLEHTEHCTVYSGQMKVSGCQSAVVVHKFQEHRSKILKAEKKVSLTMYHKNILRLVAYHQSENATFVVYPYARHTLDRFLFGSPRKLMELTLKNKMKIAIETAQAIRYMQEEYPRGPVAHCNIVPCNIYVDENCIPQVSGFKQAKWLHQEQASLISNGRSIDSSECEVLSIMKADVYSFGVLLLRLFCQRPIPRDDKKLIEWARPLMIQRNFCEVLGPGAEELDTHTVYRVLCIATRCTATRPILRPSMSEVVWTLKGDIFCEFQLSPSEGSEESGAFK